MDIAGEVQVEVLHGDNLAIAATGSAALDTKCRALAGLADAGEDALAQMSTHRLAEAYHSGAFALAKGSGGDGGDINVFPVRYILQTIQHLQANLSLILTMKFYIFRQ